MNGLHQNSSADSNWHGIHPVPPRTPRGSRHARMTVHASLTTLGPALFFCAVLPAQELTVRLVGNAGVIVSDGETSLLIDLPYEPVRLAICTTTRHSCSGLGQRFR
jgi:hypothetical protein